MTLEEEIQICVEDGYEIAQQVPLLRLKVNFVLKDLYADLINKNEEYNSRFAEQYLIEKRNPKYSELKLNEIRSMIDYKNPLLQLKMDMVRVEEQIRHWNELNDILKSASYSSKTLLEWERFKNGD